MPTFTLKEAKWLSSITNFQHSTDKEHAYEVRGDQDGELLRALRLLMGEKSNTDTGGKESYLQIIQHVKGKGDSTFEIPKQGISMFFLLMTDAVSKYEELTRNSQLA